MNTFKDAIRTRDFVLTSECFLKPETDADALRIQADVLRGHVDGVVLTDNQFGSLHMSTIAAGHLMIENELDPIVQLSCRNRNRISLLADLLGAVALGTTSFLLVRGNRIPKNIVPRPKLVLDTNATDLIAMATSLKADNELTSVPDLYVGGSITPHEPKADWEPLKLIAKADSGAQFMLTHTCMDLDLLRRYVSRLIAAKLTHRISIIVSTAILTSADDARWMRDYRPNCQIPDSLIERLEAANDPREEGLSICSEQLRALADMPGVAGANLIASTDLRLVPEAIAASAIKEARPDG
jgi:methylenetetrahydrofolate reductase (NADPH)